jgi:hypothetical protein
MKTPCHLHGDAQSAVQFLRSDRKLQAMPTLAIIDGIKITMYYVAAGALSRRRRR